MNDKKVNFELTEADNKKVYAYHLKSLKKYMADQAKPGEIKKIKLTLKKGQSLIEFEAGCYFIINW